MRAACSTVLCLCAACMNCAVSMHSLHALCNQRKAVLDESLAFFQFLADSEEEEAWLVERIKLAKSQDVGKDLVSCTMLIKRHEV